jgi:hypothetical protein
MELFRTVAMAAGVAVLVAMANGGPTAVAATGIATFTPPRISYQALLNFGVETTGSNVHQDLDLERDALLSAVQEIGLFSITDIPMFGWEKPETLVEAMLPQCVDALLRTDSGEDRGVSSTKKTLAAEHVFEDGTVRKTIATTNEHPQVFAPDGISAAAPTIPADCEKFAQTSGPFRSTVAEVTRTVGHVLSGLLNASEPLLWDTTGRRSFNLEEIITQGEHLEHFHVYTGPVDKTSSRSSGSGSSLDNHAESPPATIDWHTDQGLMLIFSPGMVQGRPSRNDFFIQLANGQAAVVDFGVQDELVVMLGEGVHQYVNKNKNTNQQQQQQQHDHQIILRAVPHALSMPVSSSSLKDRRVWYGRMVLPPSNALHPLYTNKTFGVVRKEMIETGNHNLKHPLLSSSMGCSSGHHPHHDQQEQEQRTLQEITEDSCNVETQHFCWHRCMNYSDYEDVSPDECSASSASSNGTTLLPLEVACVNSARELWTGDHNPDFGLGCVHLATTPNATMPEEEEEAATQDAAQVEGGHNVTEEDNHDHDHDHDEEGHDHSDGEGNMQEDETSSGVSTAKSILFLVLGGMLLSVL